MPKRIGTVFMTLLMIVGVLMPTAGVDSAAAQPASEPQVTASAAAPYYFEETGHYLSGRFRDYWEERGGLYVFGFPLTKVYYEKSTDGNTYLTQYFERARFEYHPENNPPYDVLLTLMGNEITAQRRNEGPFQPVPDKEFGSDCEGYFEPTQHNVQGAFCRFWQRYGGLQNFGYGLSEEFDEVNSVDGNTYRVQYFERGRWEYHPEYAGSEFEVLLGLLGLERMNRVGVPESVKARETSPPSGEFIPGSSGVSFPLRTNGLEYGFNAYMIGNPGGAVYNDRTLDKINEANFGWVRIQMVWKDVEPVKGQYHWEILDTQINAAHAKGIKVLLSIVKAPNWAAPASAARTGHAGLPEDLDAFYNTVRVVSGRYVGKVKAYEIWNEQNLAGEVGGYVEVAPYVQVLRNGFNAVKKNDRGAFVLFGGLTPTGVNDPTVAIDDVSYLQQAYAYNGGEVKQYFDALAAHPGSSSNSPDQMYPDNPGSGECPQEAIDRFGAQPGTCYRNSRDLYFRRIEDQRRVMDENGDSEKQVWLTEFGWDSCQNSPAPRGYEYCKLISEQQQAEYLRRAFEIGKTEWGSWMGAMFLWNLNYQTIPGISNEDEKYGWSILRPDFSSRPAYDAVKFMPK